MFLVLHSNSYVALRPNIFILDMFSSEDDGLNRYYFYPGYLLLQRYWDKPMLFLKFRIFDPAIYTTRSKSLSHPADI